MALATDPSGDVITAGTTLGAYPGFSNPIHVQQGVVVKFDGAGKQLWLQQFGIGYGDFLIAVATDANGDFFVAGLTFPGLTNPFAQQGRMAFPGIAIPAQGQAFAAKLTPSGSIAWKQQFALGTVVTIATAIAIDRDGNVILGGGYSDSSEIGNMFVAKLNGVSGKIEWQQTPTLNVFENLFALKTDNQGSIFVTGAASNTYPTTKSAGTVRPFVLKLDGSGQQIWLQQPLTANYAFDGIAIDPQGNAVVGGRALTGTSSNVAAQKVYLAKLAGATGNLLWQEEFGQSQQALFGGLAVDTTGSIFVAGSVAGALSPSFSQTTQDVFVAKFDENGKGIWVQQFGTGKDFTYPRALGALVSVTTDAQGNAIVGGNTTGAFPGFSNPNGAYEAFVAKFGP